MSENVPSGIQLNGCTVTVIDREAEVDVCIDGDLDLSDHDEVARIVIDAIAIGRPTVRLRLERLVFADSSALRMLLASGHAAGARGVRLELVDPLPQLRRLLEVTGVDELFNIVTTTT